MNRGVRIKWNTPVSNKKGKNDYKCEDTNKYRQMNERSQTQKQGTLYDPIYLRFKNRSNQSILLEIRAVGASSGEGN